MATATTKYESLEDVDIVDIEQPFLNHHCISQSPGLAPWAIVLITVILTATAIFGLEAIFWTNRPRSLCMGDAAQKGFLTEWGKIGGLQ